MNKSTLFSKNRKIYIHTLLFADSQKNEEEINQELVASVRRLIGPIAAFKVAAAVKALPSTRSGKICRKSIANLARSKIVKVNFTFTILFL